MSRMQQAKKEKTTNDTRNSAKEEKPKGKEKKTKTQSSHTDLMDSPSAITPQDKAPEIVSELSDQKHSAQNAPNTPAPQLPPTHVDSSEEPAPRTSSLRGEKLEWYGSWKDD
jgi:hypothetical protein